MKSEWVAGFVSGSAAGFTGIRTQGALPGRWSARAASMLVPVHAYDWFNNRCLLEPIGNIPPAEAEERYYAMLDAPALAA